MELEDFLSLASDIVYAKTGEPLSDLQQAILRGTFQRHTYSQIARTRSPYLGWPERPSLVQNQKCFQSVFNRL
ncbi:MAG: hypothetical protein GDA48_18295 [Hormoscilla sp. GM102CHS1]|nr:hypothetical protein [Hormoscilla sp. GM102CHS1]